MRLVLALAAACALATPALAYDGFSPISGPNDTIDSPVCDVINFGFCPQPPAPPPPLPDADVAVAPPPAPPPPVVHRHRRSHRAAVPAAY